MQEDQNTNTPVLERPIIGKKINKRSVRVSKLIMGLILMAGVGNIFGGQNSELVSYYNKHISTPYNQICVESWNKVVDIANSETATSAELATALEAQVGVKIKALVLDLQGVNPPEYAAEFHKEWVKAAQDFSNNIPLAVGALKNDSEDLLEKFNAVKAAREKLAGMIDSFQNKLKIDKGVKFEKA